MVTISSTRMEDSLIVISPFEQSDSPHSLWESLQPEVGEQLTLVFSAPRNLHERACL